MAKLTTRDRDKLERVLYHIRRARKYIGSDRVAVCQVDRMATTTEHYTNEKHGNALYPVAKDIGSDLCGLEDAERFLLLFLNPPTGETAWGDIDATTGITKAVTP